ncbi:hypothetical protein HMPREF1006_02428 [Synergistes sp. 3_1_syn1]|nr:hypothetical protein HMPREF1006_02428 [Synergistes sp. 3_1_syn1]
MMKCGKTKIERYRAHLYRTVKATDLYIVTVFYMITIYIKYAKNSTTPI